MYLKLFQTNNLCAVISVKFTLLKMKKGKHKLYNRLNTQTTVGGDSLGMN